MRRANAYPGPNRPVGCGDVGPPIPARLNPLRTGRHQPAPSADGHQSDREIAPSVCECGERSSCAVPMAFASVSCSGNGVVPVRGDRPSGRPAQTRRHSQVGKHHHRTPEPSPARDGDTETLLLLPEARWWPLSPDVIEMAPGTELALDVVNSADGAHDLQVAGPLRARPLQPGECERFELGVVTEPLHGRCTIGDHGTAGMTLQIRVAK